MTPPAFPQSLAAAVGLAVLLSLASVASAQSCTAVAYLGGLSGTSCTGEELGDASMDGPGFGPCEEVINASCVLTEQNGPCAIHLYSDGGCQTPITGGNTINCGDPATAVDFTSFQVEC